MSARMTTQEAVRYLTERDRGCTVYNGDTIFVFHRKQKIGELRGERGFSLSAGKPSGYNQITFASLSVAKLAETEAA